MPTTRQRRAATLAIASAAATSCALFSDLSGFSGGDDETSRDEGDGAMADGAPRADAGVPIETSTNDACAEAELASDPSNCGRCGHDCFGGACLGGKCLPATIASASGRAIGVAAKDGFVYVARSGALRRMLPDGGGGVDVAPIGSPGYLAASATHLYWCDPSAGTLHRWPVAGGGAEVLVTNVASALGVAVGDGWVYFTRYTSDGGVERVLLDGGSRQQVLGPYDKPEDVELAFGELIVGGDGVNELAVHADAGFGPKRVLSSGKGPVAMAVDGDRIFFVQQSNDQILTIPFTGGGVELLATEQDLPVGIAVTADSVYWVNAKDGGSWSLMRLAR